MMSKNSFFNKIMIAKDAIGAVLTDGINCDIS